MTILITLLQRFFVGAAVIIFFGKIAFADTAFRNLSQSDFDNIVREYSANSALNNVMPASSMGSLFGFELGFTAGATTTPEIKKLAQEVDANAEASIAPHAGIVGAVTIPFGLTAEASFIPTVKASGIEFGQYAAALKWTFTDVALDMLPVNLAVRGFLSKSTIKFDQTVNGGSASAKIDYDGGVTGVQLMVSPKLVPFIEPYAAIGFLSAEGDMAVTGATASDFYSSGAQSATSKPNTTQFLLGFNARLALIVMGLEYSRAFDTNSVTGKFSFRF